MYDQIANFLLVCALFIVIVSDSESNELDRKTQLQMAYKNFTPSVFCVLLLTLCMVNVAHAQYDVPDFAEMNATSLLELFDNFDIQKYIRDMQRDGSLENIAQILLGLGTTDYTIGTKCMTDFFTAAVGVSNFEMWALQMIDAIGKPHTGILSDFDITWDGSYDECLDLKAVTFSNATLQSDPVHHFDGKYCKVGLPIPGALNSLNPFIGSMSKGKIKVGICIPDSCDTGDMRNIMLLVARAVFNASEAYEPDAVCHDAQAIETKTIVAACVLSLFGVVVVIGTLYDIYTRLSETTVSKAEQKEKVPQTNGHANGDVKVVFSATNGEKALDVIDKRETVSVHESKPDTNGSLSVIEKEKTTHRNKSSQKSTPERVFLAFSVYSNGLKILNTNQPKGALTSINGIRFFSMTWVILGHSLDFSGKNSVPYFFTKKVQQWTFYGIYSATVSVDTFFTMSGLLVSYLTLREMSKRGGARKMNWFLFYFHRYWRLTPVYMLVLMINSTIVKHLGDGPRWPQENPAEENCEKYWWANLLYINNYYPGVLKMCFGWSWYLANDMQFYILSPLIIIPLFYNMAAGSVVACLFLIGSTVARAVVSKQHEYTALFGGFIGPKPKDQDYMDNLYFPGHTRIGPYVVGLLAGYLLYRYKDSFKMKKIWNFLGWLMSLSIIVLCIYGVYPDHEQHYLTVNESVTYVTLHRTGWGIAVCWIIFACATGNGGWINDFLSWSPFGPLGRLSYCAYLVHPIVMNLYISTLRQPLYYTDFQLIYYYIGNTVLSYMTAFVTSLMFEAPMMGLEKVMLGRP